MWSWTTRDCLPSLRDFCTLSCITHRRNAIFVDLNVKDFNVEVLENATMLNVRLALFDMEKQKPETISKEVRFFGGEFETAALMMRNLGLKYDQIIASEILYSCNAYASILKAISMVMLSGFEEFSWKIGIKTRRKSIDCNKNVLFWGRRWIDVF